MTDSQECDDQMLIEDDGLRCVVKMEPEAREISKRIILLIACLSALCDCLLLSVIGIYGQFIFWLFSTSFINSLTRNLAGVLSILILTTLVGWGEKEICTEGAVDGQK